ncbi:MAG: putative secreted protein [Thermoleophilia bacterium]|nr:putative secreted protein [Thermoleophilia bacterium]
MQPLSYPHRMTNADRHDSTEGAFAHERDGATFRLALHGEIVTPHLVKADTMWSRMRGLLGRGALAPSEGLWISPCSSIHMFFMRFSIDAVFIDQHLQVVRVVEDLKPWRMSRGGKFAHSVLELPPGKAAFFNIRVGDKLAILSNA